LPLESTEDEAVPVELVAAELLVRLFVVVALVLCACEERAAASEMTAVAVSAPAANQRVIRRVSRRPRLRVLMAWFLMPSRLAAGRKKTLSRP
jgi:hypothetical protein